MLEKEQSSSSPNQEIEILLKEYDALRAEIISRLESQTQLTTVATLLIGGIITALPLLLTFGPQKQILNIPPSVTIIILLIISTLFTSLFWTYLEHDIEMAYIGQYFNKYIRLRLASHITPKKNEAKVVISWDRFRSGKMALITSKPSNFLSVKALVTFRSSSRYVLMSIPILFCLVCSVLIYKYNPIEIFFSWISIFIIIFFIFTLVYFTLAIIHAFEVKKLTKIYHLTFLMKRKMQKYKFLSLISLAIRC